MTRKLLGLSVLIMLVLAACSRPGTVGEVTDVTVSPSTLDLVVGDDDGLLTAEVTATGGASEAVTWTTSDADVATVDDGVVSAVGAGTATITATSDFDTDVSGSATVTVTEPIVPSVTGVSVSPSTLNLLVGDDGLLTVEVTATGGASEAVTWTTSDADVATVDGGVVSAVGAGTATITATSVFDTDVSGSATVTVTEPIVPTVTAVTVTPAATDDLEIDGAPLALTANVTAVGDADASVTWTSDDEDVATVDDDGLVTAVGAGDATITATSDFNTDVSGSATVTVLAPSVTSISISTDTPAILTNETAEFTAVVVVVSGASRDVIWSSSNEAVATIDSDGVATPLSPGTTEISATSRVDSDVSSDSLTLTVADAPAVISVTVEPADTTDLQIGGAPLVLTASVGVIGGADEGVTWTSDDLDEDFVEVVDNGDGTVTVTAVGAGTATITATSVVDDEMSGSATVTVLAPGVTVSVSPQDQTVDVAEEVALELTVDAVSGAIEDVTWTSDDEDVATVDDDGRVAAVAPGTAVITATSDFDPGVSDSVTINVRGVIDVAVAPDSAMLAIGGTTTLTVNVTQEHLDEDVTWVSSDSDVATVVDGVVTAEAVGTAEITATSVHDGTQSASATVQVYPPVTAADYFGPLGYMEDDDVELDADVSGGLAPYTFELTSGTLPVGLELNADNGSITGSSSAYGPYSGTITVTDALNQTAEAEFGFAIVAPLVVDRYFDGDLDVGDTAPDGADYFESTPLVISGGLAPFAFDFIPIDVDDPEWADRWGDEWSEHDEEDQLDEPDTVLSIDEDGVISGTATWPTQFWRTYVRTTDVLGNTDVTQVEIAITELDLILEYANTTVSYTTGQTGTLVPAEDVTVLNGRGGEYSFSWSRIADASCDRTIYLGPIPIGTVNCSDSRWNIDALTGEISRNGGGSNGNSEHNGVRTYRVTVHEELSGREATFEITLSNQ